MNSPVKSKPILISDLDIKAKPKKLLAEAGIHTIQELTRLTKRELRILQLQKWYVGIKSYADIILAVERLGFKFKDD